MKKTIITIESSRNERGTTLYIKSVPELEKLFESMNATVETSTSWKKDDGTFVQFYKMNDALTSMFDVIRRDLPFTTSNEFGRQLDNSSCNLAILRMKGIADGITFDVGRYIGHETLKSYIEQLAQVVKILYSEFIKRQKVVAKIILEV